MLKHRQTGKLMVDYHSRAVRRAMNQNKDLRLYEDVYSRYNFPKVCGELGGAKGVRNYIFLMISTDGENPFKSAQYSYCPIVTVIFNLPRHIDKRCVIWF